MAKYFLTNKAVEDLSKIWEYTHEVWSESQADKYYELLTSSFQEIVQNPEIGKNYDEIDSGILGLRVGKHIVFYQVAQSSDIEIIRIFTPANGSEIQNGGIGLRTTQVSQNTGGGASAEQNKSF